VDPHAPIKLSPEYAGLFSAGATPLATQRERLLLDYDRATRQADDQFARLRAALEKKGWWRRSTIVYLSDHGEEFFEHGGLSHGSTIYEEQVRVPLLIKYPQNKAHGQRRSDPVSLADITPTLARVCGLPKSRFWIGKCLQGPPLPADRILYFTEDLDTVRIYGIMQRDVKVVVQLYPVFSRRVFSLAKDRGELSGTQVECGDEGASPEFSLLRRLEELRDREVEAFPAVRVDKSGPQPLKLEVSAPLGDISEPFLRAQDYCRYAACVRGKQLTLEADLKASDRFSLVVSADEHGRNADLVVRILAGEKLGTVAPGTARGPVRVSRTVAHFLSGSTTDEMLLRNLKSLGYMQ